MRDLVLSLLIVMGPELMQVAYVVVYRGTRPRRFGSAAVETTYPELAAQTVITMCSSL